MKRTPLKRKTPLRASFVPEALVVRAARATAFPPEVQTLAQLRSGWRCERCDRLGVAHFHHRRPKGMGGTNLAWVQAAANAAHLCGPCHEWVHAHPAEAYATGWLIRKGVGDMADMVPMTNLAGARFFFDDEGDRFGVDELLRGEPNRSLVACRPWARRSLPGTERGWYCPECDARCDSQHELAMHRATEHQYADGDFELNPGRNA